MFYIFLHPLYQTVWYAGFRMVFDLVVPSKLSWDRTLEVFVPQNGLNILNPGPKQLFFTRNRNFFTVCSVQCVHSALCLLVFKITGILIITGIFYCNATFAASGVTLAFWCFIHLNFRASTISERKIYLILMNTAWELAGSIFYLPDFLLKPCRLCQGQLPHCGFI